MINLTFDDDDDDGNSPRISQSQNVEEEGEEEQEPEEIIIGASSDLAKNEEKRIKAEKKAAKKAAKLSKKQSKQAKKDQKNKQEKEDGEENGIEMMNGIMKVQTPKQKKKRRLRAPSLGHGIGKTNSGTLVIDSSITHLNENEEKMLNQRLEELRTENEFSRTPSTSSSSGDPESPFRSHQSSIVSVTSAPEDPLSGYGDDGTDSFPTLTLEEIDQKGSGPTWWDRTSITSSRMLFSSWFLWIYLVGIFVNLITVVWSLDVMDTKFFLHPLYITADIAINVLLTVEMIARGLIQHQHFLGHKNNVKDVVIIVLSWALVALELISSSQQLYAYGSVEEAVIISMRYFLNYGKVFVMVRNLTRNTAKKVVDFTRLNPSTGVKFDDDNNTDDDEDLFAFEFDTGNAQTTTTVDEEHSNNNSDEDNSDNDEGLTRSTTRGRITRVRSVRGSTKLSKQASFTNKNDDQDDDSQDIPSEGVSEPSIRRNASSHNISSLVQMASTTDLDDKMD